MFLGSMHLLELVQPMVSGRGDGQALVIVERARSGTYGYTDIGDGCPKGTQVYIYTQMHTHTPSSQIVNSQKKIFLTGFTKKRCHLRASHSWYYKSPIYQLFSVSPVDTRVSIGQRLVVSGST